MSNAAQQLFDLTPTDEQRMNRDTMQRFAAAEMRAQAKVADASRSTPDGFYDKSAELGLALLPIPEALGGAGVGHAPIAKHTARIAHFAAIPSITSSMARADIHAPPRLRPGFAFGAQP